MQFLQYWVQKFHLYIQIVSKNIIRVRIFEVCKTSGDSGYLTDWPDVKMDLKKQVKYNLTQVFVMMVTKC
jgi:hypothetical protein